jgi:hypothetical protein
MFKSISIVLLLLLLFCLSIVDGLRSAISNNTKSCYQQDEDCPVCPSGRNESFTSLWIMSNHVKFMYHTRQAEQLIKKVDSKNIIRLESLLGLHVSLNYFCCHSKQEKDQILSLLKGYQWSNIGPFSFQKYHCNVDHAGEID